MIAHQLPLPLFPDSPETLEALYLVAKDICPEWYYDEPGQDIMTFKYLGKGSTRAAYDLGNGTVVKVEFWDHSNQCKYEWNLWNRLPADLKKFFCPIIAHDVDNHRWTIMPKVEGVDTIHDGDPIYDTLNDVCKRFDLCDLHSGNIGFLNGEPVVIDYAQ